MLRIIAHKIAQLLPERYPDERAEQQFGFGADEAGADRYDQYNVYFIQETFMDPATGQETSRMAEDGYESVEAAEQMAQSSLQESIEEGAVSVDIVHKTEGWQKSVWSREEEPMPQPMSMPFSR